MTDIIDAIEIKHTMQTLAFYNCENLFDFYNDKRTNDNDYLSSSAKKWTRSRYENKLRKLSFVISNIGKAEIGKPPAIVGLAEVENAKVIKDLISCKHLKEYNYGYIHYNSLDARGIDVALIYDKTVFEVLHSETFSIDLIDENGNLDFTRDILLVSGLLAGEKINVLINHWPSRREGEKETEYKRMTSANKVGEIIAALRQKDVNAKIVIMGDFNDDPSSRSIKHLVETNQLYNATETLRSFSRGSVSHFKKWNLFDQIIFSANFFESSHNALAFYQVNIFDADFLKLFNGKYKGTPFRTYAGKKYIGGYSDHFPVYVIFKKS